MRGWALRRLLKRLAAGEFAEQSWVFRTILERNLEIHQPNGSWTHVKPTASDEFKHYIATLNTFKQKQILWFAERLTPLTRGTRPRDFGLTLLCAHFCIISSQCPGRKGGVLGKSSLLWRLMVNRSFHCFPVINLVQHACYVFVFVCWFKLHVRLLCDFGLAACLACYLWWSSLVCVFLLQVSIRSRWILARTSSGSLCGSLGVSSGSPG